MNNQISKALIAIRKPALKAVRIPTPVTYVGGDKLYEVINILEHLKVKKVMFIVGGHILRSGEIDHLLECLEAKDINYLIRSGISPDPSFKMVEEIRQNAKDVDAIVAIGGGSVLDVAKIVKGLVKNEIDPHKLVGMLRFNHKAVPLIAIPTTAGTGSEVTLASVISEDDSHLKRQILDPRIVPEYAILDPKLTTSLSLSTSYHTGFDALTHALEAYVSTYADKQSKHDSEIAIKLIFNNLLKLKKETTELMTREALLLASYHAGKAFTRVYIGYVHAFGHALGAKCQISHREATAILLPLVMNYYRDVCEKEFSDLALILGHDYHDQKLNADFFLECLAYLNKETEIAKTIKGFDESMIDEIINLAFKECHGTYPVPKYFSYADAYALLLNVCETKA